MQRRPDLQTGSLIFLQKREIYLIISSYFVHNLLETTTCQLFTVNKKLFLVIHCIDSLATRQQVERRTPLVRLRCGFEFANFLVNNYFNNNSVSFVASIDSIGTFTRKKDNDILSHRCFCQKDFKLPRRPIREKSGVFSPCPFGTFLLFTLKR